MTIPPSKEPPAAMVCAAERTDVPEEAGSEPPEEPEDPLVDVAFVVAADPEEAVLDEPDLAVDEALVFPPDEAAESEPESEESEVADALAASAVDVAPEDFFVVVDLEDFLVVVDFDDFLVVVAAASEESAVLEAFAKTLASATAPVLVALRLVSSQSRLSRAGRAETPKARAKVASWIIEVFILMMEPVKLFENPKCCS
jgi:hypothetical protein